jgi:PII-like signaling protein
MNRETEGKLLRVYIGEDDHYQGKALHKYLLELFHQEGLAGATVLRGLGGFGPSNHVHTTSILRLSTDLPIVLEVADTQEKIARIKVLLEEIMETGLITVQDVKMTLFSGKPDQD